MAYLYLQHGTHILERCAPDRPDPWEIRNASTTKKLRLILRTSSIQYMACTAQIAMFVHTLRLVDYLASAVRSRFEKT